ncbi:MAG: DLW-39 family protein [Dermatophilaceae bacterium]
MKKIVALAVTALAGLLVARRAQVRQEEQALWAEVTDTPPAPQR